MISVQSPLSKRTLSKADPSLRRTAKLVPAEYHLSLSNWTLSKADNGHFFQSFGSKNLSQRTLDV